jgi:hypothetical protein
MDSAPVPSLALAGPISDCCVKTVQHAGQPRGNKVEIAGIPTYVTGPTSPTTGTGAKRVVLYFPDVFGPFYLNGQLLQDYYAAQGAQVSSTFKTVGYISSSQVFTSWASTTSLETLYTCTSRNQDLTGPPGLRSRRSKLPKQFRNGLRECRRFTVQPVQDLWLAMQVAHAK